MCAFRRSDRIVFVLAAAFVCFASRPAEAQDKSAQAQQAPAAAPAAQSAPEAKPADVASPDAILAATYDVISGPPGDRDWNRFYSLFLPDARLISTVILAVRSPSSCFQVTATLCADGIFAFTLRASFPSQKFGPLTSQDAGEARGLC